MLHTFHFMLYSMLEESGGSNGNRSLRYRQNLTFFLCSETLSHKRALGLVFPYKCFFQDLFLLQDLFLCSNLSGVLTHHMPLVLIGRFLFGFSFFLLQEWDCLRDTEMSPFVEIFKICPSWSACSSCLVGAGGFDRWPWEVPQICEKYSFTFTISARGVGVTARFLKTPTSKLKFAPNFTQVLVSGS